MFLLKRIISLSLIVAIPIAHASWESPTTLLVGLLPSITDDAVYWPEQLTKVSIQALQNLAFFDDYGNTMHSVRIDDNFAIFVRVDIKFPKSQNELDRIEDKTVLGELSKADVIIGEFRPSVYNYARENSVPYILTKPTDIRIEKMILETKPEERVMFSAWPSWRNFFQESIKTLLQVREEKRNFDPQFLGRVLILQTSTTNMVGVANELLEQLVESNTTTWVKLMTVRPDSTEDALRAAKQIVDHQPAIVVFMYDRVTDINFMKKVLQEQLSFGPQGAPGPNKETYLWDMSQSLSTKWRYLLDEEGAVMSMYYNLRVITTRIDTFYLTCDKITTDLTAAIGGYDAFVIVMNNVMDFIPNAEYNKTVLLDSLRKTNSFLAGVEPFNYDPNLWRQIVGGLTFKDGFKFRASSFVGKLSPTVVKPEEEEKDGIVKYKGCEPIWEISRLGYENLTSGTLEYNKYYGPPDTYKSSVPKEYISKIVVVLEEPFALYKGFSSKLENKNFKGLTVDLVDQCFDWISRMRGKIVKYELYKAPGNHYGIYNKTTKTWNGAMGELQSGAAVMAIGMISKTKQRSHFFDYTLPFEYVGFTYMRKKASLPSPLFNFMRPFELTIWYAILATFFLAAIFVFIIEYWNPFYDPDDEEHKFDFKEVFWFSFGTITGAGGSFAPVMHPTRVFSVFYWFFALIITASYTGNLATFLTEAYFTTPDQSIEDLGYSTGLSWATLRDSYMDALIRSETSNAYRRVAREMNYVDNYTEGINYINSGDQRAFIANNLLLHYYEASDEKCQLALSPQLQSYTELAFPMNRAWVYSNDFLNAMVHLRDEGKINDMSARWIGKTKRCVDEDDSHTMLDFHSFRGLYLVLAIFIIASFIILTVKLVALKMRDRKKPKTDEPPENREGIEETPMIEIPPGDEKAEPEVADEIV